MREFDERHMEREEPAEVPKIPKDPFPSFLNFVYLSFTIAFFTIIFQEINTHKPLRLTIVIGVQYLIYNFLMKRIPQTAEWLRKFCEKFRIKIPILYFLYMILCALLYKTSHALPLFR